MTANESPYRDWQGVESALKAAAATASASSPGRRTIGDLLVRARHDRFLSRVFADAESSGWLLKGGTGMLARVPEARHTQDVDLSVSGRSLDDAVADLQRRVQRDYGDHMRFELLSSKPAGQGDTQPGLEMRQVVFACFVGEGRSRKRFGDVKVDVVVGPPPTGKPDRMEPATRLHLARELPTAQYLVYPVADQMADKVCATMSHAYPGGRASSRVKDLVDLVILGRTQIVGLRPLQVAIESKRVLSRIESFDRLVIPDGWEQRYRVLAGSTPAAGPVRTVQAAAAMMDDMLVPALAPGRAADGMAWRVDKGWTSESDLVDGVSPDTSSEESSGDVWVRSHDRNGHHVEGHWRSARGGEQPTEGS